MNVPTPNHKPETQLPPAFRTALRDAQPPLPEVPPTLDQAIINQSRQHLRQRFATRNRLLKIGLPLSAAAALALAFLLYQTPRSPRIPSVGPIAERPTHPHDLNADGTLDILDAFTLAQHLRNPTRHPHLATADPNADGQTNTADVDFLAQQAVTLR
ncbi:MAG: dockerin type I domain-containing protein [Planctomycetota bacterium]